MNILILNQILFTADNNVIPKVKSIKDTMIYNMCLGFTALGHTVTLAAGKEYKPTEEETYDFEIKFFSSDYTKLCPPSVLPFSKDLFLFLKQYSNQYDLVIASEAFSISTLFSAIVCPRKTVIWHELTEHQNKFHRLPSKCWHNIILPVFFRKIRCVIPRSSQAREFISRYLKNTSAEVVDHGINIDSFKPASLKKRQFICISQLIPRKNVGSIIIKFSELVKIEKYKDVKLYIAGRGIQKEELVQLVSDLHMENNIRFLGFLDHKTLSRYASQSLASLIDTHKDLNMVSIPECIVSGTPIVTNLKPASASYIAEHRLGIAKKEWDKDDLIEIIENNPVYRDNCIHYREKLTNRHAAETIIKIYKQFCEK